VFYTPSLTLRVRKIGGDYASAVARRRLPVLFGASFEDKLSALGMKCLTVAGGFMVGYVLGWLIAVCVNKWVIKKERTPESLKQLLRVVCGIAVALLVAVSLMWGSGDGTGGDKEKAGTSDAQDTKAGPPPSTDAPKDDRKQPAPATPIDTRPTELTIRVTVLGGTDVRDEKFYLLDDDRSPKSLREVKDAVLALKTKETRKTVVAVLRSPAPNRVPLDHGAVSRLVAWVQDEAKLDITFPVEK
jgi:hypothetical protein